MKDIYIFTYGNNGADGNTVYRKLDTCTSCKATEELNGDYTLEMQYPMSGSYYSLITVGKLIYVKANQDLNAQFFRIYRVVKTHDYLTAYAEHVSYILKDFILPTGNNGIFNVPNLVHIPRTPIMMLVNGLKRCGIATFAYENNAGTDESAYEDADSIKRMFFTMMSAYDVLDKTREAFAVYNIWYRFDSFNIIINEGYDTDNPIVLSANDNIQITNVEYDISDDFTHCVGYYVADSTTDYAYTSDIIAARSYVEGHNRVYKAVDFTNSIESGLEASVIQDILETRTKNYVNANYKAGVGNPALSVSVIAGDDNDAPIDRIHIGAVVSIVMHTEPYPGSTSVKQVVSKTVYDCLLGRYESFEVGEIPKNNMYFAMNSVSKKTSSNAVASLESLRVTATVAGVNVRKRGNTVVISFFGATCTSIKNMTLDYFPATNMSMPCTWLNGTTAYNGYVVIPVSGNITNAAYYTSGSTSTQATSSWECYGSISFDVSTS